MSKKIKSEKLKKTKVNTNHWEKNIPKHSLILSLFSVVISAIAVIFTYQQNEFAREHNRLSVTPQINSYFVDDEEKGLFGVYAFNNGLGTALVTDLQVFVDGEEITGDSQMKFLQAIKKLELDEECFIVAIPRQGDTMSINTEYAFIKIKNRELNCTISQFSIYQLGTRFNYTIHYESLYGEKFKYTYLKNEQIKL